jgi:hypothetical protein
VPSAALVWPSDDHDPPPTTDGDATRCARGAARGAAEAAAVAAAAAAAAARAARRAAMARTIKTN